MMNKCDLRKINAINYEANYTFNGGAPRYVIVDGGSGGDDGVMALQ